MRALWIHVCLPIVLGSLLNPGLPTRNPASFTVPANLVFSSTGIYAAPNTEFRIIAAGLANLADEDGPYITDPNGTLMQAPPSNYGAYGYFRDYAAPVGKPPILGKRKFPLGGT